MTNVGQTRMQVLSSETSFRSSGGHLWRGIYSVILGAGPAHALHFATFEYCKEYLDRRYAALYHQVERSDWAHLVASGVAGACGTIAHDAFMTPFDGKRTDHFTTETNAYLC